MKLPFTESPYKQNDLFRGDPARSHLNACVGINGGPYDFFDYARGYIRAAESAIETASAGKNPVDILIYPIAYCYRHAIELYLKHLLITLPRLWDETYAFKPTHLLSDNWHVVRTYIKRDKHFDPDANLIFQVDQIINDFVDIDPTGEVFRFPIDRQKSPHLQDTPLINVLVLGKAMSQLARIFEYWDSIAERMREEKLE